MSRKLTFVFVPGSWHTPPFFKRIEDRLAREGYNGVACGLPAIGGATPTTSSEPDVAAVSNAITEQLQKGNDVICVPHSSGGSVATDAIGRLGIGKDGKTLHGTNGARLRRVVYVASTVPKPGQSQVDVLRDSKDPDTEVPVYYRWEGEFGYVTDAAADIFYHDEEPTVREELMMMLRPHALAGIKSPVKEFGWRYVPSTYVFTTKDRAFPYSSQTNNVNAITTAAKMDHLAIPPFGGELGKMTMDCGHCAPFGVQAEKLTEFLLRCAREKDTS